MTLKRLTILATVALLLQLLLMLVSPVDIQAQDRPTQRQLRTYVPPDQLVSFLPSTPFSVFIDFLNPITQRVTGRQIVDPTGSDFPIGISIGGMHFMDAIELVLDYHGLRYRETDRYFVIEEVPPAELVADAQAARGERPGAAGADVLPATVQTREVQINAILFELNVSRARELGIDWNVLFGQQTGSGGAGGGGGGAGTGQSDAPIFRLRTRDLFEDIDNIIDAPDAIELSTLTRLFRLLENEGIGETVANPQITVQSGEQGRIQIGSDIPVQIRDFSGNTITQFYSTGIIVNVVPTLVAGDDTAEEPLDFIHLDVKVEKSAGRPTIQGLVIDRNDATTQVLLLNGEQTIIGGLYSTEEIISRRGIPVLKDLPWWFFGLRYVFGFSQRTTAQKELLIVLQAEVRESLTTRSQRPLEQNMLQKRRNTIEEVLRRSGFEKEALEVPDAR